MDSSSINVAEAHLLLSTGVPNEETGSMPASSDLAPPSSDAGGFASMGMATTSLVGGAPIFLPSASFDIGGAGALSAVPLAASLCACASCFYLWLRIDELFRLQFKHLPFNVELNPPSGHIHHVVTLFLGNLIETKKAMDARTMLIS